MHNPLVSILIAQYNNGLFFKDCYHSVIEQTYPNWEVIIVDDGSTDDSFSVIQALIKNDTRFKLFSNEKNSGCGYTKQRCVSLSTGEICGFLDPDDTLETIALEKMVLAHLKHPEVSVVTSKYYLVDINLQNKTICTHGEVIPANYSYLTYGKGALTAFATFKNNYYKKTNGIDAKFTRAVDQDLYYKLEEVGTHYFLDEVLYNYRINNNSISSNQNLYKAQYWHFIAMQDAFKRRKNLNVIPNFTDTIFCNITYDYWKSRMKFATSKGNYLVKLYFLSLLVKTKPFFQIKYKLKCLLLYKYS